MADNTAENNKSAQMMSEEGQAPQEFVLLSDDVKASLIRQEQIDSSSPLSEKQNIPEKSESKESVEVKSKDSGNKDSSTDPLKTNALYFIGINSLALNLLSASSIFTSASAKTVTILWINLFTYLALYQRQPILTFLTKMTKKTGQGLKKTKEVAQKKKGRLFIIVGILAVVGLVVTFQHMNVLIDRLQKQNCEQSNILRNLQLELNDLKLKTQRTNQMLHQLDTHTSTNQEDSAKKVYTLTKQVKELEQVVSTQQQQIQSFSKTVKRDDKQFTQSQDKQTFQRSGIKEDRAGNVYMGKTERTSQQATKQEQEQQKQPQQQCKTQDQTQQQKPQYKRQNAMKDDRLDFITNSFMELNNIIPLI